MTEMTMVELVEQAKARVANMSDAERATMHEQQRQSFVRAMMTGCEHGVLDFEDCQQCRDKAWSRP